jgi:hypothetical protein
MCPFWLEARSLRDMCIFFISELHYNDLFNYLSNSTSNQVEQKIELLCQWVLIKWDI